MKRAERAAAKDRGLKRYFTGKPCKHGHVAERIVTTGQCVECVRVNEARRIATDPAKVRARKAKYWQTRREQGREYAAKYRAANPDHARAWFRAHPDQALEYVRKWKIANPDKVRAMHLAHTAQRRASMRSARCTCCSNPDFQRFYEVATLVGYDVDHIVPLVDGGKHCIKNLQFLSPPEHRQKTKVEAIQRTNRRRAEVQQLSR